MVYQTFGINYVACSGQIYHCIRARIFFPVPVVHYLLPTRIIVNYNSHYNSLVVSESADPATSARHGNHIYNKFLPRRIKLRHPETRSYQWKEYATNTFSTMSIHLIEPEARNISSTNKLCSSKQLENQGHPVQTPGLATTYFPMKKIIPTKWYLIHDKHPFDNMPSLI